MRGENSHLLSPKSHINAKNELEKDIFVISKKYLRKAFTAEALANIPFFVYEFYDGIKNPENGVDEHKNDKIFVIFWLLKIFRILHLWETQDALKKIKD